MGSLYEGAKYFTWFSPKGFTQSLGKARVALPFDPHPVPGNFSSVVSDNKYPFSQVSGYQVLGFCSTSAGMRIYGGYVYGLHDGEECRNEQQRAINN